MEGVSGGWAFESGQKGKKWRVRRRFFEIIRVLWWFCGGGVGTLVVQKVEVFILIFEKWHHDPQISYTPFYRSPKNVRRPMPFKWRFITHMLLIKTPLAQYIESHSKNVVAYLFKWLYTTPVLDSKASIGPNYRSLA